MIFALGNVDTLSDLNKRRNSISVIMKSPNHLQNAKAPKENCILHEHSDCDTNPYPKSIESLQHEIRIQDRPNFEEKNLPEMVKSVGTLTEDLHPASSEQGLFVLSQEVGSESLQLNLAEDSSQKASGPIKIYKFPQHSGISEPAQNQFSQTITNDTPVDMIDTSFDFQPEMEFQPKESLILEGTARNLSGSIFEISRPSQSNIVITFANQTLSTLEPEIFQISSESSNKTATSEPKHLNTVFPKTCTNTLSSTNNLADGSSSNTKTGTKDDPIFVKNKQPNPSTSQAKEENRSEPKSKKSSTKAEDTDWDDYIEFSHDVEKFVCKKCKKYYKTRSSLVGHLRNICGKTPKHFCPYCSYKAYSSVSIRIHMGKVHHSWPRLNDKGHWVY